LVNSNCHLRIADFGMAKLAMRGTHIDEADEHCFYMTQHVATLPYRAPELLFVLPEHSTAVDMWAVGCIFGEMLLKRELFPGRSVSQQIKILISMLGSPHEKMLKQIRCDRTRLLIDSYAVDPSTRCSWTELLRDRAAIHSVDLIDRLTVMDPMDRLSVQQAIDHPYLRQHYPSIGVERGCPFKVKMDMAAVESLSHEQLIAAMVADVRSADLRDMPDDCSMTSSSNDDSITSTDPSLSEASTAAL